MAMPTKTDLDAAKATLREIEREIGELTELLKVKGRDAREIKILLFRYKTVSTRAQILRDWAEVWR